MWLLSLIVTTLLAKCAFQLPTGDDAPFLQIVGENEAIIGNSIWNATMGANAAKPVYYREKDIIGDASGYYFSYAAQTEPFIFGNPTIVDEGDDWIDVCFSAAEGDFHWVIYRNQHGAYQYFVNTALPFPNSEFRSLVRLDNHTFTHGYTSYRQEALPELSTIHSAEEVQDATYRLPDGSYISKYDFSDLINTNTFWGVYGEGVGSFFIHASKDYINGNHLKQELMVHREDRTGDVVLLNMIRGSHFMTSVEAGVPEGKVWGPWLWYLNDGSVEDAKAQYNIEVDAWPYAFPNPEIDPDAHSRASSIEGSIILSDGQPAARAAIMLGDNNSEESTLDQASTYYYRTTTDGSGRFAFHHVRPATYALYAWPGNNTEPGDVSTSLVVNDLGINEASSSLGNFTWPTQDRTKIWQIGRLDRLSCGFGGGCSGYHHGLSDKAPADLNFTIGSSQDFEWYYVQASAGTWQIIFELDSQPGAGAMAILTTSFAGYSAGAGMKITAQGGKVEIGSPDFKGDGSVYRGSTFAGVHHFTEYEVPADTFTEGTNTIEFTIYKEEQWKGFLWDSILLEWS